MIELQRHFNTDISNGNNHHHHAVFIIIIIIIIGLGGSNVWNTVASYFDIYVIFLTFLTLGVVLRMRTVGFGSMLYAEGSACGSFHLPAMETARFILTLIS